ncbi:unnamed protein product [Arctogadus glacialis]
MTAVLWSRLTVEQEERHQKRSKVTSAQSLQQHQTELIKRAEENAHAFLDKELKRLWRVLLPDYPQCSESQREEEVEVDGKKEEQRRRAIEGVVDITKLCLMEMNKEELADTLWAANIENDSNSYDSNSRINGLSHESIQHQVVL